MDHDIQIWTGPPAQTSLEAAKIISNNVHVLFVLTSPNNKQLRNTNEPFTCSGFGLRCDTDKRVTMNIQLIVIWHVA